MNTSDPKPMCRRGWLRFWYFAWPTTFVLIVFPIKITIIRVCILGALFGLFLGLMALIWKRRKVRCALLLLVGCGLALLCMPGRNAEAEKLRRRYVGALVAYEGTRYIWGGESRLGMDCSGLVRKGFINANFQEGVLELNPLLIRNAIALWWFDSSARALGDEYRAKTRRLFSAGSLNSLDYTRILPGDFAVTVSGVHALAYLGDQMWIEADPTSKRVVKVRVPDESPWFEQPVYIMRWKELAGNQD